MSEWKRIIAGWTMILSAGAAIAIATQGNPVPLLAYGAGICVGGLVLRPYTPKQPVTES